MRSSFKGTVIPGLSFSGRWPSLGHENGHLCHLKNSSQVKLSSLDIHFVFNRIHFLLNIFAEKKQPVVFDTIRTPSGEQPSVNSTREKFLFHGFRLPDGYPVISLFPGSTALASGTFRRRQTASLLADRLHNYYTYITLFIYNYNLRYLLCNRVKFIDEK